MGGLAEAPGSRSMSTNDSRNLMACRAFMRAIVGSVCNAGPAVPDTPHRFGPRFERAIALIDEANAPDPVTIEVDGRAVPKELTHARMLTAWVERLLPEPGEALLLAAHARAILEEAGYDDDTIARVERLIRKETPKRDPEGQAFEDGLTLVFLETQLHDFALQTDPETMAGVIQKTWRKISPEARELALASDLAPEDRALIERALA